MLFGLIIIFGPVILLSVVIMWWLVKIAFQLAYLVLMVTYRVLHWAFYLARRKIIASRARRAALTGGPPKSTADSLASPEPAAVPQLYSREFWRSWVSPEPQKETPPVA